MYRDNPIPGEYVPLSQDLLKKNNYEELVKSLEGLPVADQIKTYQDIYDSEIPFDNYYWNRFPNNNMRRNGPCPLHDEAVTGESFAIDTVRNMWQCFGKCKMVGRATQFELMYGRKTTPNLSRMGALKRLHKLYPALPKPQIFSSSTFNSMMDNGGIIHTEIKFNVGKTVELNHVTSDLSHQILQSMLIEKNFDRK